MPKAAPYTMAWSPARNIYEIYDNDSRRRIALDLTSSIGHDWLKQISSFAFRGRSGTYTARKEQIKQGDSYWYAYQRAHKKVHKKYLGKSETLTLRRLEEIASLFGTEQPAQSTTTSTDRPGEAQRSSRSHDQILAAKLRPPLVPHHLVVRTRLLDRLQEALVRPVTLISAPAGFGKSTLLSDWLHQSTLAATWLSLDQADNDPLRFWSYLFTALETLYPGVGERALQALRSPQGTHIERVLTLLINLLGDGGPLLQQEASEVLLVLDDYHVISAEEVHQGIAFLIERLPPHLHLIITARSDPPLPLARLRLYEGLLVLRAPDLQFTSEETAAFFARQSGVSLGPKELALLQKHTEGWAAGLQLVSLRLQEQHGRTDVLQSIGDNQRYLAEYLGQEVLAQLPEQIQEFLLRTSILEQLEGSLCEAVSGQPDGAGTLAWLAQKNLFLTPLDESHRWYRYHQIFADVLRQRLQQSDSIQIQELQRRATRWYREQGMLAEAVAYARTAEDWESIASIAEEAGMELISRGETLMVMNWVALLPRPLLFSRLRLFLFECWFCWYSGRAAVVVEMVREYVQQHALPDLEIEDAATLEQAIITHVDTLYPCPHWSEEQRANRIAETLALYGVLTMQRSDRAAFSQAVCRRAVVHVTGLAYRARILQHLGTVSILRGDLAAATAAFEEALASAIADGSATWVSSIGYRLGMLYEMMGRLLDVTRIAQDILQLAPGKAFLTHGTAYILLGSVEYERNHLEAAERYFKLAIASCGEANVLRQIDPYIHFLLGQLRLARIKLIWRDRTGTRQCLEEIAGYLSRNWVGAEVLPVVKGEYALLMHNLGDKAAGRQWLEEFPSPELGKQLLLRQFISLNHSHDLVYIKLLLAYQPWQEAEQILQEQQALAEQQGRTGSLIQWLTLHALFKQAQSKNGQALLSIARALSLAESRGYSRMFLDEGAPLLTLLYQLHDELRHRPDPGRQAPTLDYLARLILLYKQEQQTNIPPSKPPEQSLVEPLSGREMEVLWHISAGRSNREIAGQLVVALSTVKSHIRAIYAKLEVKSRTQALARAHSLKLL